MGLHNEDVSRLNCAAISELMVNSQDLGRERVEFMEGRGAVMTKIAITTKTVASSSCSL